MSKSLRALILEQSEENALILIDEMRLGGYRPTWKRVQTAAALRAALKQEWDIILSEYSLPRFTAIDALKIVRNSGLDVPFLIVSGSIGEELAVEAIKTGVNDCIIKENLKRLAPAVAREIHESKLRTKENELRNSLAESAAKYQTLFEMAPNGILHLNIKGKILACNRVFLRITGFKTNDIVGKHFTKLPTLPKKKMSEYIKLFAEMVRGRKFRKYEFEWLHENGSLRWGEGSSSILKTGKKITGIQIVLTDITERKLAETRLKEQEEELRRTLAATTDGIWMWNFKADTLFFSPKYYTMLGYKPDEFPASYESWTGLIHPDDLKKALAVATEYLKTKPDFYENEFRLRTKNGDFRWIQARARVVERDKNGEAVSMIGNHEDITERKQSQEEIRESRDVLIATLNEKVVLLKEIHHRVKNNLQIIISLLNLQEDKMKDEEAIQQFKNAKRRIYSIALVHEKLYKSENFSKIDFGNYIQSITQELTRGLESITLVQRLDPVDLGIDIALPCGLIVNELVTNALKHAFPDRRGTLSITLEIEDKKCRLVICDNGIGLPEDIDLKTTESLGLRLVNILTRQIDADLTIERNEGTTFIITFNN